jgi:chorismate dehydratase
VTKIAKIDYINLLPFSIFLKKNIRSSQLIQSINYKKNYPSKINKEFKYKKVGSAFISSIESKKYKNHFNLGIIANGEVWSVLSYGNSYKSDFQSATSNVLAKILEIDENVIIGDKALKLYFDTDLEFKDLSLIWKQKYNLPFVFAVFVSHNNNTFYKRLTKKFLKTKIKIPRYILKQYSQSRSISEDNILKYLDKIYYTIDYKEKKSLKLFFNKSRKFL